METGKISRLRPRSVNRSRTWPFHVVVLQKTAKKCAMIYNARAQPLFCSLNLLFGDVLVAVVVVVCLSSLLECSWTSWYQYLPSLKSMLWTSWYNSLESWGKNITALQPVKRDNSSEFRQVSTTFFSNHPKDAESFCFNSTDSTHRFSPKTL